MTGVPVGLLVAVAVLGIALAAMLSAGEAAVLRITRTAVAQTAATHPRGNRLVRLTENRQRTAGALAFARILAEMTATACLTVIIAAVLDSWWQVLLIAIAASTLVGLLLVRLSPRSIGRRNPRGVLVALGGPMTVAVALFGWASRLPSEQVRTDDELRDMVERVNESEVIEEDERALIRSVFELGSTLTREVMVPRTDMVSISAQAGLDKALSLFLRSGFSRVPVVGTTVDDLEGVLYFKDVVARLRSAETDARQPQRTQVLVAQVMRPALFVPESKPVDDLLREFQAAPSHMALVVDEYGGVAGLVTIEDALEEIVGEVTDEHDATAADVEVLAGGALRVPARMPLDELGERLGTDLEDDEVDTVGGLLAKTLGRVPIAGSAARVHGLLLEADGFEGRRKRLSTVRVRTAPERTTDHRDTRTTDVEEHA
ncbi:MAG: hemolysin family protein [Cellulomonadaceae bacterium]